MESSGAAAAPMPVSSARAAERVVPASLLALIILSQLPSALTLTVTAPLLADMAKDLIQPGSSTYLIKMVTGIVAPALIVGAPLGGWLADRFDRRPLLFAFGVIFILSAVAPAFLDSAGAIVAVRFVSGACGGALSTIGMAMVGTYYPPERRPGVIGILAFLTLGASILTLPLAGALATAGWRNAFFIFLALVPLIVLAAVRTLPPPTRDAVPATGLTHFWSGWPRVPVALLLIAFVNGLAFNLAGIFYSFYFTDLGIKNVGTISLLLMYQAAVAGAATLLYARTTRHFSTTTIFMVCLGLAALGLGTQGLVSDWRIAAASLTFTGLAMGLSVPNISVATIALVPEHQRGAALGLVRALGALAALLGVSQPLQTALGIQGIFLSIAALAALVLFGLITRLLPLRPGESPE